MVDRLRNFDVDRLSLEELVELSAIGRFLTDEFEKTGVEVPEWLSINLKSLRREIKTKIADQVEKTLRDKRTRLASLMPTEERRKKLAEEIAELEKLQTA
jgi:hypothetical protein